MDHAGQSQGDTMQIVIGNVLSADDVKIGVLVGSVIAGVLASLVLLSRNATYRRIHEIETADADHDGVPDIYESRRD